MKKKRFHSNGRYYEIPEQEVGLFLKDNPDAYEVKYYELNGKKYNIPLNEVSSFENDMGLKKKASIADVGMAAKGGGQVGVSKAPSGETTPIVSKPGVNVESYNTGMRQKLGVPKVNLGSDLPQIKKAREEKEYLKLRDIEEKDIIPFETAVFTGTVQPTQIKELANKPYGKKVINDVLRDHAPEAGGLSFDDDVFRNEQNAEQVAQVLQQKFRQQGLEIQNQNLFNLDKEVSENLNGLKRIDIAVSAGTGGGAANVSEYNLPQLNTSSPSDLGEALDFLSKSEGSSFEVNGRKLSQKEITDLSDKINEKLYYIKAGEPIHPEILSEEVSTKLANAVSKVDAEWKGDINYSPNQKQELVQKDIQYAEEGLNFLKDANKVAYNNIMNGILKKEKIADVDYEQLIGIGKRLENEKKFRGGEFLKDDNRDFRTYQTLKADEAKILSEKIKEMGFKNKAKIADKVIVKAALESGIDPNSKRVLDIRRDEALGGYGIVKGGGLTALARGISQPFKSIQTTLNSIFDDPTFTYLNSRRYDYGDQIVPDAAGNYSDVLPSERGYKNVGNVFNKILEGAGQFATQVFTSRLGGQIISAPYRAAALSVPRAALTTTQATNIAAYGGGFLSTALQTYGQSYVDFLNKTGNPNKASLMALIDTLGQSAIEVSILPDVKLAESMKDALGSAKRNLATDIMKVVEKGGGKEAAEPFIKKFVQGAGKVYGKEILGEEVSQNMYNYLVESIFSPETAEKRNLTDETKEVIKEASLSMVVPIVLGGLGVAKRNRKLTQDALHISAQNFETFTEAIENGRVKGIINPQDADAALNIIKIHQQSIENAPKEDSNGGLINAARQLEYAYQNTVEQVAKEKLSKITDEVQAEPVKKQIEEAQAVKRKIFNGAEMSGIPKEEKEEQPTIDQDRVLGDEDVELTPEQKILQQAIDNKEISGVYLDMAKVAVNDPQQAKQLLDDAKSQAQGQVAGEFGNAREGVEKTFGKSIVDFVLPKAEAGSVGVGGEVRSVNDFANENESYRVIVGDEAFNDIVESGTVRTNAGNKGGESLSDKLKNRPTLFPSFSKGKASMEYAAENPNNYIIVTEDASIQPSKAGRHGKGTTMFPTDKNGNHLKELSGEKVKVYKHIGNGEYILVYANGKVVEQSLKEQPKAGSVGVGGDVMKGVNDKIRQTELEMEFKGNDAELSFKNNDVEIVVAKPIGADGKYSVTVSEKSDSNTGFTLNEGKTKLFDTKLEALEYAKEQKEQSLPTQEVKDNTKQPTDVSKEEGSGVVDKASNVGVVEGSGGVGGENKFKGWYDRLNEIRNGSRDEKAAIAAKKLATEIFEDKQFLLSLPSDKRTVDGIYSLMSGRGELIDALNSEAKAVEQSLKETPKAEAGSVGVVDVVEGETKVVNGRELTFYNIKGYDESTGFAVEKNKNGYIIHSAMIPMAKQRQGIGTDFYIRMNKESIKSTGNPLKSSERLSNSAGKPFWEKLVDKGYAEKAEDGYKFILSTKGSEIKPENAIEVDRNVDRKVANVPNGVKGKLAAFKEKYAAKEPEPEIAAPKPKVVSKDKQTRTNDIVSRVRQFNQLRKNAPNKASELNAIRIEAKELGYEVKYGKGLVFLKTTSGNKVQSKSSETNSSIAKNFSKDNYSPETNSHIETILADDGIMTGLPIKGEDGYRLSEKQKASALKSIRDGKPINGAKAIYDFLEKAVNDGEIEIEDKITGQEVKVPVSEYFDAFKEPVKEITDTELDELNSMLNEEAFKEAFENEKNIVYEADNEGSSEPVGKTAEGQTIENQKAAISGKEAAGVSGKTPEGVRKKISFERNDEKIKEKLKNIDSLLKDLGKPDLTMGGLSKIEPLTKLIGNLVEVGYYKIEDIAKFLIEKGYNEWIPYLKDAYNDFKDKYDLSPEVKSALSNGNEINSFAGGLDKGTPASQKVNDIQGRRTPTGTVGGKVAAGRPPIRIADEKNLPTPKKEHIVDGKYDIDENQRLGANLAIDRFDRGGKAFLLADGAGVGKTREILVVAKEMADKTGKKTLIVTESNAILADTYAKDADALGIDLNKFEVGTYSDLAAGKIGKGDYGIAIYDESHNLKNPLAQRSIAQSKVKSSHNMFASATPMDKVEHAIYFLSEITDKTPKEIEQELGVDIEFKKGRDGETYSIATTSMGAAHYVEKLLELRGEAVKNGSLIRREYPFYGEMENKQVNMSAKDNAEKNKIEEIHANRMDNADNIAIGRLVNEKLNPRKEGGQFGEFKNDLANKMAFQGLFDKIKKDYEAGRGGYYSEAKAAIDKFTKDERFALLQNLDKINEQAKANDIYESVKKDLADGKQSIVVGNYSGEHTIKAGTKNSKYGYYEKTIPSEQTLLNAVAKKLEAEGIKVSRIYGGNKAGSYTKEQNDFQSGKTKVMLMTAKSGGTGINLDDVNGNAPRVMHIATSEYSGNKTEQLFGRVSRRNTKSPAEIKSYFFDNMADNNRAAKSKEKQATIRNIVAGKEDLDKGRIAEAGGELSTTKEKKEANIGLEKSAPGKFVLTGDTFDIKDTIKELGGRWEKYKKGWEFPESKQDEVKAALAEKHPDIKLNFSIQEKTPEAISDMKDIVKDLVEDGTSSLKNIQKIVADELGDKSQEMKDLVQDSYYEYTKDKTNPKVVDAVIERVQQYLSRVMGGEVVVIKSNEEFMEKADEVGDPQYQNQPLTPEQKATTELLNAAKADYQAAKSSFDAKRKSLDKEILKDQSDLFGERKSTQEASNSLFDERVSQQGRDKAIEPYKARMLKAEAEVNRLQKKLNGLGGQTAQTSLFMQSPDGNVLGFTKDGKVYLNGEYLNPNTPIHEAGHIWTEWSKKNQPEVYNRGIELVTESRYFDKAKESNFYQKEADKLPETEREAYFQHEALAMAIGDKGAQFVTEARRNSFKEWLSNLWDSIKKAAGFKDITAKELSKLTFDEFTKRAAKDILDSPDTKSKVAELEAARDMAILKEGKPDVKLEFVSAKELVDSKDPIGNRNIHNDIKERFKKLKEILDCIHG